MLRLTLVSIFIFTFTSCAGNESGIKTSAGQKDDVSTESQFPEQTQNQLRVGSCHTFASVALMEAAISRRHSKKVKLSEAHLYLSYALQKDSFAKSLSSEQFFNAARRIADGQAADLPSVFQEGDFPDLELKFALAQGVGDGKTADYGAFYKKYNTFRSVNEILRGSNAVVDYAAAHIAQAFLATLGQEGQEKWKTDLKVDTRKIKAEILGGEQALMSLAQQAKENGSLLRGARVVVVKNTSHRSSVEGVPEAMKDNIANHKTACLQYGEPMTKALQAALDKGIPAALSMDIGALPEWKTKRLNKAVYAAYHAFIIKGYRKTPEGIVFTTRNSWGPERNVEVPDYRLCRATNVTFLVNEGEPDPANL